MTHLPPFITDLAIILITASFITLIFRRFKWPVVLGYLLAGFFVGPHFPLIRTVSETESVKVWAELGVIVLLFTLGLEFSFRRLAKIGRPALMTGLFALLFMLGLGYLTGLVLGWTDMNSLFLGGILCISSTMIIVKSFEEQNLKGRSFAALVTGVLIVEDLVAILLLVLLSTIAVSKTVSGAELLGSSVRLGFFLVLWTILGTLLIPRFIRWMRPYLTDETTLVVSLGLCLGMVLIATTAGFSPALGAFVMGSLIAETALREKVEHLVQPVKDLFGAIFFVSMGMLVEPASLPDHAGAIVLITLVVIVGKLLANSVGALLAGESLRKSIQTGLSLAQIGEFSFIIAALGISLGVVDPSLSTISVMVAALTSMSTPFMIAHSEGIADWIESRLPGGARRFLEDYRSAWQKSGGQSMTGQILSAYGLKILVHGTLIVAITIGWRSLVHPLVEGLFSEEIAAAVSLISVLILSSPFYWGFIYSRPGHLHLQTFRALDVGIRVARITLGAMLCLFTIGQFMGTLLVSGLLATFMVIGALVFSRAAKPFYRRIESHLRQSRPVPAPTRTPGAAAALAPWDAQLTEIQVSTGSEFVGQTLLKAQLKERFGVMVALIERGEMKLLAPGRETLILPGDLLAVIGTDEQVEKARIALEKKPGENFADQGTEYSLFSYLLRSPSPWIGRKIRESGLREQVQGLIVGLERDGQRILNPDSALELRSGDLLWIVGDPVRIPKHRDEPVNRT